MCFGVWMVSVLRFSWIMCVWLMLMLKVWVRFVGRLVIFSVVFCVFVFLVCLM